MQLVDVASMAGVDVEHRNAGRDRVLLRRDLVARHLEHVRAGADEGDAGVRGRLGEVGVLGEEAVAGVDRVGAGELSATRMISETSR